MKGWFTRTWSRFRGLPLWVQILLGLLAIGIISGPLAEDPEEVASTNTTTTSSSTTTSTSTTTTLPPLPPGDDVAVARIIDGDTFEVVGASAAVRLIGIDTPENTTSRECFGPEATTRLSQLIEGQRVCLVYDVERQDRSRRTLAYVYRLSDGMFVNLTMAKEGFAVQLTVPPNVAHAEDLRAAAAEARTEPGTVVRLSHRDHHTGHHRGAHHPSTHQGTGHVSARHLSASDLAFRWRRGLLRQLRRCPGGGCRPPLPR